MKKESGRLFVCMAIIALLAFSVSGINNFFDPLPEENFTTVPQTTSAKPEIAKVEELNAYKSTVSSVALKWKETENAEMYYIYAFNDSNGRFELAAMAIENNCTVSSLLPGTVYRFKIRATARYNGKTIYGKESDEVTAVTSCKKVKSIATTSISKNSISISWKPSDGATSYEVWIFNREKAQFLLHSITNEPAAVVENLAENELYNFKVRAVKNAQNAVSYSAFSDIFTEFTDTSGLPYTKAQAANFYNACINSAKQTGDMNVLHKKRIDTETISCSNQSLLRTVKNIMNLFNGEIKENYKFSNGNSNSATVDKLIEPEGKKASVRAGDILKFSAKRIKNGTYLKLVLKQNSGSYNAKTKKSVLPPSSSRAVIPPLLENIRTSPIKVRSANEKFTATTLSVTALDSGKVKKIKIICNCEITAACRVASIKFKTKVGYKLVESYNIK